MTTKADRAKEQTITEQAAKALSNKPTTGFDPSNVKVKGHIVVPALSIKDIKPGESIYVKAMSEITSRPSTELDGVNKGKQKMDKNGEPAMLHTINAIDLESGELGQMVLPAIVHSGMTEVGALTGRSFKLTKGKETTGKATKWAVAELEV